MTIEKLRKEGSAADLLILAIGLILLCAGSALVF